MDAPVALPFTLSGWENRSHLLVELSLVREDRPDTSLLQRLRPNHAGEPTAFWSLNAKAAATPVALPPPPPPHALPLLAPSMSFCRIAHRLDLPHGVEERPPLDIAAVFLAVPVRSEVGRPEHPAADFGLAAQPGRD